MDVDIEKIRELADLALDKGIAELTVTDGDTSVVLRMPSAIQPEVAMAPPQMFYGAPSQETRLQAPPAAAPAAAEAPKAVATEDNNYYTVTSPMVGTFYRSSSPESAPFVEQGDTIATGQTLCIIEAMKLMNELESEITGKVVKILVQNGQPVEFGQPLMQVDTSAS